MLMRENAGVAGYSDAFMYGQSGKQASVGSGYLITAVLVQLSFRSDTGGDYGDLGFI
jgi:hypothetical protein